MHLESCTLDPTARDFPSLLGSWQKQWVLQKLGIIVRQMPADARATATPALCTHCAVMLVCYTLVPVDK